MRHTDPRTGIDGIETIQLPALGVEVFGGEPGLEGLFSCGPFGVEHAEPGGVAVAALDDHVLAEDAFKCEAEAQGGLAAGQVFGVALPLVAAVAEIFKDVPGHEVVGLSGGGGALQGGREQDVAHLDYPVGRVNAHVACVAGGLAGGGGNECQKDGVRCGLLALESGAEG